jgi:hypothetical protein
MASGKNALVRSGLLAFALLVINVLARSREIFTGSTAAVGPCCVDFIVSLALTNVNIFSIK